MVKSSKLSLLIIKIIKGQNSIALLLTFWSLLKSSLYIVLKLISLISAIKHYYSYKAIIYSVKRDNTSEKLQGRC